MQILSEYSKDFTVSAEVTKDLADEMVEQGLELAALDPHIVIKIPMTEEGIKAVRRLSDKGIRTNVTLCFSVEQALLAAKAGAFLISPFLGRLDDIGEDGLKLVHEIRTVYDNYGFDTQILSASIRSINHVKHCSLIGSDVITMPYKVFAQMFNHSLTDKGLEKFKADWEEFLNGNA